jgi:CRP/FNR family transcriptional regulator, cyclic AMP receptor protein
VKRGNDTKVEAMAKVPLFSRCSRSDLGRIAQIADEVDLRPGRTLAREGTRGREFFVLLEGTADVTSNTRLLPPLKAGDFFGEIALVCDEPRTATVTATSPLRALVITDRAFRELLRNHPGIQGRVLEAVASRLAATLRT